MLEINWWSNQLVKCPVDKMTSWQNDQLSKWLVDKMTIWQNDQLTKWPVVKMTSWQNDHLTKWLVDKMTSWQNDQLTKWPVDKRMRWQRGPLTKWPVDKTSLKQKLMCFYTLLIDLTLQWCSKNTFLLPETKLFVVNCPQWHYKLWYLFSGALHNQCQTQNVLFQWNLSKK